MNGLTHGLGNGKVAVSILACAAFYLGAPTPALAQIAIANIEELQAIGRDPDFPLDGTYVLVQDIDASATVSWNGGAGFEPIGYTGGAFTGTLDGQNHVITGLSIDRVNEDYIGLFSVIGPEGFVRRLTLEGSTVTGYGTVGGFVGFNEGYLSLCYYTGEVAGVDGSTGGLAGKSAGTMSMCAVIARVSGYDNVGGLAGRNSGGVSACIAIVELDCGFGNAGGLVGVNAQGTLYLSNVTGSVACDYGAAGGLAGWNTGLIAEAAASCTVSGEGSIGGLVGTNKNEIRECYATGDVIGGYGAAGGLVGWSYNGAVLDCYATGRVFGATYAAGLVGMNELALVTTSHSVGEVYGSSNVGGLVAYNNGSVEYSFWNRESSGMAVSDGGIGLSAQQMRLQSSFTNAGWDFEETWMIRAGNGHPQLGGLKRGERGVAETIASVQRSTACHAGASGAGGGPGDVLSLILLGSALGIVALRQEITGRARRGW